MKFEELKQNRYIRNMLGDKWLILASAGLVVLFALLYIGLLYAPTYKAGAKVWIKDTSTSSYLSDTREGSDYLRPLTSAGNPVATQIQILTSAEMERYLATYVVQRETELNDGKLPDQYKDGRKPNTKGILKVKTEPNTDVMDVQLKWHHPLLAKEMLDVALKRFDEINLNINSQIFTKKRDYLQQQLNDIEGKLMAVRNRIKDFQAGNLAVDVDSQTQELVRLRAQLVAQMEAVRAAQRNSSANASVLQRQVGMAPTTALTAVALGSGNENLVKMRSDLNVLQQQYAHDSVRQASTNPQLVALKQQINALQNQINAEVRQTVGRSNTSGPRIYDNVRSQLVQDMASSRARSAGLGSEASSLSAAIGRVDAALRAIPQNKFTLSNLQEEERTLASAYDELRRRQIDASIKEAETPSNVFIVDAPTVPERASFPTALHLLALSIFLGLMAGAGLSVLKTYTEDLAEGLEAVEEATRGKVLGVIPWLARPVSASSDDKVLPISDVAHKHIVSNMRISAAKNGAEVIAFTSTSLHKPQFSTAYSLAQRLNRLGQSVALIDADFRPSGLAQFVSEPGAAVDLTDLILDVELKLRKGEAVYPEEILTGLIRDDNGVYLALNRRDVDHAYDYFASRGFRHIVNMLKEQFDWVFIDTPSAAIAPEFMAIADMSDGVVLFADRRATFSGLRRIASKIRETQAPLLGTIIREKNTRLEQEHQQYVNWRDHWRGGGGGGGLTETAHTVPIAPQKRVEFMGAKIDALTMQETLAEIRGIIQRRDRVQHVVVNVAKLMTMRQDSQLKEIVNSSALINADGAGVVMGARLLGIDIPERVAGIDLMQELVKEANMHKYRLFFLGAEEDVVRDVVTLYKHRFPSLQICGYRNGYFKTEDELSVAHQIRDARPDILFVAMGSPKKEKFIRDYMNVMDVPFVMGVGGSFDVVAGKVKRAPAWMQNAGLEWFYRFAQEPARMWKRYLVTNLQYGWTLGSQLMVKWGGTTEDMRPANG